MTTAQLTDDELRRELRKLCNQGRHGPADLPRPVAAALMEHGLAEQLSDAIWVPTPRGRRWCDTDDALAPPRPETDLAAGASAGGRARPRHAL